MKNVTIIGAGRSGRGMLGELYSREGCNIVFADKDKTLLENLEKQGYYTVKMTNLSTNESRERKVDGFSCVDTEDKEKYYQILNNSDIISTAVLPDDFDEVIRDLAKAVKERYRQGIVRPMVITLGANYVGMTEYFDRGISGYLDEREGEFYKEHVFLLMSIVNRKNMFPQGDERTGDALRVIGDDKSVLQVQAHPIWKVLEPLPSWMVLKEDAEALMAVKLWAYNLVQTSMVAVGIQKGYTDTYACSYDYEASKWAYFAAVEGYGAVEREYGLAPRTDEENKNMVTVFRNENFKDSCYRIIRNPIRKLKRNERFTGPALCAVRQGIMPYYITKCCAYMFLYQNDADPETLRIRKDIEIVGIGAAILKYCELCLEREEDRLVYELILNSYRDALKVNPLD